MCDTPCNGSGLVCIDSSLWNETADFSHFFAGVSAILLPVVFLRRCVHPKWVMLVVNVLFFTYTLVKELWYDPRFESTAERGSDIVDILTYLSGAVMGNIAAVFVFPQYDRPQNYFGAILQDPRVIAAARGVINEVAYRFAVTTAQEHSLPPVDSSYYF